MGRLTTHVLDTASGRPGAGIHVSVRRIVDGAAEEIATAVTNHDGRCDAPLLEGKALQAGVYELVFGVGAYFGERGDDATALRFLNEVVLRFGVGRPEQHYHVPLLLSPYGYTTYRGS